MSSTPDIGAAPRTRARRTRLRPARLALTCLGALGALVFAVKGTQDAVANGDTRSISIIHMHTKEQLSVTFKRNGYYDAEALKQLNWLLRDWRSDQPTRMDPRLFDVAWEVHRSVGASGPFQVVSAYRSPGTNSMLRRRSRGVAKHSQHMEGKAMDFYIAGVSMAQVRAVGMKMQRGGVGYYPSAYTPFVHLDVGSVRSWPRMTRGQLAQLFPDGRTVHIAADGQPLSGYEMAKADIIARGGTVGGFASGDFDEGAIMQGSRRSLWASLFGWNEEDESRPGARTARGRGASQQAALAPAPSVSGDNADMYALNRAPLASDIPAVAERPMRSRRGQPQPDQTQIAAAPPSQPTPSPAAVEPERPASEAARALAQIPAQTTPAQPRLVNAPLPVTRPAGLQPVQTAAAGQPGQEAETAIRLIDAPQPPRRPVELPVALALAGTQAAAPVAGPSSPAQAVAGGAGSPISAAPGLGATAAPLAPPRDPPGRLVTVSHPAPPERPRALTAAAPMPSPAPVATAPRPAQEVQPANPDRRALDNLFAAAATGAVPRDLSKVTVSRTSRAAPPQGGQVGADTGPAAALGFSQRDPNDTRVDRFTGPAVRPLPTTFTSR